MIGAVITLYFTQSATGFYLVGAAAGFALTGTQSVSRTMIGQLSPPGHSAEFYGLYAVAGRASSFIGPAVFGILAVEATDWYAKNGENAVTAEQLGHRIAILSIVAFLVVGLFLLSFVNEHTGRQAARTGTD